MNIESAESPFVAAVFAGALAGMGAAIPIWVCRRAVLKGAISLGTLRASDILAGALAAIVISPFGAIAGFVVLWSIQEVAVQTEVLGDGTITDIVFLSVPATMFYVPILIGMQVELERRMLARATDRT
jgi:hypothetical protein